MKTIVPQPTPLFGPPDEHRDLVMAHNTLVEVVEQLTIDLDRVSRRQHVESWVSVGCWLSLLLLNVAMATHYVLS